MAIPRPGTCAACAAPLPPGTQAWWDGTADSVTCVDCRPAGDTMVVADETRTATACVESVGGDGRLAEQLDRELDGIATVLHGRKVPLSRGSIDHLVVAPTGIWIIDANNDAGRVERRDVPDRRTKNERLYVGHRDRTDLVCAMGWHADAVRLAVEPIGFGAVPIRGCLCFTDAEWGLRSALFVVDDVRIGWATALIEAIRSTPVLDVAAATTLSHHLSSWFPASR